MAASVLHSWELSREAKLLIIAVFIWVLPAHIIWPFYEVGASRANILEKFLWTFSWIMLKNGERYLKNFAVFTPQYSQSMFGHFSTLCIKRLRLFVIKSVKFHCVKRVRIWSFSGTYFPAFGLNQYLSVFSPNAGEYVPEKLQIRTFLTQYLNFFFHLIFRNTLHR